MHGTTTTRIINQPHETRPPSFRQFLKGRRGEMVRRATPAPALDKNHHPLHVFPLPAHPVRTTGMGTRHPPTTAPLLVSARHGFSMPPCSSMRRPAGRTTTSPLMSHQSSLTRSGTAGGLLYASSMIRRTDSYITIIPTSILICGR